VAKASAPQKYVICNADEGDPGAFMDRSVLESDPHRVLEGMAIAGYAVGANQGYVYVRAEYPLAVKRLRTAIRQAERLGAARQERLRHAFSFNVDLRIGAGAFVCGEETALIASIEGRGGTPRPRPPYPAERALGLSDAHQQRRDLRQHPADLRNGGEWFADRHREEQGHQGVRARGQGRQHRPHRGADGHDAARDHLRGRRRHVPDGRVQGRADRRPLRRLHPEQFLDMPVDYDSLARSGRSWARAA
jgi:bidirectional [NiFe] hydrogenase diaphorase subunit